MNWNWNLIYNTILFGLSTEEILTVIFSIWDRPISNIILQIYPSFVLIGNLGLILNFLNCKITMGKISISEENVDIFIQILYLLLIFLIFIFDIFFLVDNKTFDENKKLLLISEKYKLLYVNGILGGLVNIISIMYQCFILIKTKYKIEKTDVSLNRIIE
jgi:hypothetical protein